MDKDGTVTKPIVYPDKPKPRRKRRNLRNLASKDGFLRSLFKKESDMQKAMDEMFPKPKPKKKAKAKKKNPAFDDATFD